MSGCLGVHGRLSGALLSPCRGFFHQRRFVTSGSEVLKHSRVDVLVMVSQTDLVWPARFTDVIILTVITAQVVDRSTYIVHRIPVLGRTEELSGGNWLSMRRNSMLAELPQEYVGDPLYSLYIGEGNMTSLVGGAVCAWMWYSVVR